MDRRALRPIYESEHRRVDPVSRQQFGGVLFRHPFQLDLVPPEIERLLDRTAEANRPIERRSEGDGGSVANLTIHANGAMDVLSDPPGNLSGSTRVENHNPHVVFQDLEEVREGPCTHRLRLTPFIAEDD
jgi:hypothetical protein